LFLSWRKLAFSVYPLKRPGHVNLNFPKVDVLKTQIKSDKFLEIFCLKDKQSYFLSAFLFGLLWIFIAPHLRDSVTKPKLQFASLNNHGNASQEQPAQHTHTYTNQLAIKLQGHFV